MRYRLKSVNNNPFIQNTNVQRTKRVLIWLSLALLLMNITVIFSTKGLVSDYYSRKDQATWHLLQLQKEFSQLAVLSPFTLTSKQVLNEVKVQYDITWTRLELIVTSFDSQDFYNIPKNKQFFDQLYNDYKVLDGYLSNINDESTANEYNVRLNSLYMKLVTFLNKNYQLKNADFLVQIDKGNQLANVQVLLVIILCFCIAIVIVLFKKESIIHRNLALTDSLTGVNNRLSLFKRLKQRVQNTSHFSLFVMDLNGFKLINDTYGHQAGDILLRTVSKRFANTIQPFDADLFRMGGDEFAIILDSVDPEVIEQLKLDIIGCMEQEIEISDETAAKISVSVGVSLYPKNTSCVNQLIKNADDNMYKMKQLNSQ